MTLNFEPFCLKNDELRNIGIRAGFGNKKHAPGANGYLSTRYANGLRPASKVVRGALNIGATVPVRIIPTTQAGICRTCFSLTLLPLLCIL